MAQPKYARGEDRGSELHAQRRAAALERVGQTVAEVWRLDALVGLGGSAAVYAASHRDGRPAAAIKMLHADLAVLPTVGRRFLREAYVANRVGHSGAPVVLEDGLSGEGTPFLVLELLRGRSLDVRGREGPAMAVGEVLSLARAVLDILAAAHAKGVVHRDVKPSNIFLTDGGSVHLLDFGIARMRAADEVGEVTTQSGLLIGTPQFMAPEQARGHSAALDARTDLWALGAVMYWLLTGRHVHAGATALEIVIASATQPAPRLASSPGGVAPALAALVDRALAFSPKARWSSAREMQAAIDEVVKGLSADEREARPGAGGPFSGDSSPPNLDELDEGHSDEPAVASRRGGRPSAPAPGPARHWGRWGVLAGSAALAVAASLRFGASAGAGAGRAGESGPAAGPSGEAGVKQRLGVVEAPGAPGSTAAEGARGPGAGEAAPGGSAKPGEAMGGVSAPGAASAAKASGASAGAAAGEAPGKVAGAAAGAAAGEAPGKAAGGTAGAAAGAAAGGATGRKGRGSAGGHEGARPPPKGAGSAAPTPSLEDPHAAVPDEVLDRRK